MAVPVAPSNLLDAVSDEELELLVNGEPRSVPRDCTLAGLLDCLGFSERRIAVAINRSVVPRSTFQDQRLAKGDRVEILEAVGGG
jgi:thiamine biosynthesis protein ThiS